MNFIHSKCKLSSLRSQCWMRLFLWFWIFYWIFLAVFCRIKAGEFYERSSGFQTFHRRDVWKGKSIQIPLRHLILQRERDLCWVGEKQANQIDVNGCYIFSTFHTIKRPTFEVKGRKKKSICFLFRNVLEFLLRHWNLPFITGGENINATDTWLSFLDIFTVFKSDTNS